MRKFGLRRMGALGCSWGLVLLISGCVSAAPPAQPGAQGVSAVASPYSNDGLAATHGPRLADIQGEPQIRVRVARNRPSVRVATVTAVTIRVAGAAPLRLPSPVSIERSSAVWRLTDARGGAFEFRGNRLDIDPSATGETMLDDGAYPGRLSLVSAGNGGSGLDAINTVGMETYLPGVLQRELFPNWAPEAFRAQAVAARSYALWEVVRSRSQGRGFDLESTTASQAYVGVATNPRARDGVSATRGVVMAWDQRVLPAFYASSHGPYGADGATTFVGRVGDLPPLRAVAHGSRDANSPRFNWQASRGTTELAQRVSAWGRANKHAVANVVPPVRDVRVAGRNAVGRHTAYVVIDGQGRQFQIASDALRHAANHDAEGYPEIDRSNLLFSGQFVPTMRGRHVLFLRGHGHGHGVGMSQYGAQAMALQGHRHADILATYYPGIALVRAY
ncbi:MAG: SpoIID/LytB domain-containing protein [Planctomycetota bacterium]